MAQWRLRDPGSFPPQFHTAMREGPGVDKFVGQSFTKAAIKRMQVEWQLFRYSLRHYAGHPSAVWEDKLVHRTKIVWDTDAKVFKLLLTSREKVFKDLIGMSKLL